MSRQISIAKSFFIRGIMFAGLVVAAILQVEAQAQAQVSNKMPAIDVVGLGNLHRTSANKAKSGAFLPPWTNVEVTNVFGFKVQPRAGSRATFVPIDIDLDQFDLNLKGSTIQDGCQGSPKWWSAEFQPITDPRVFDIRAISSRSEEFPFDVVVIYPAVASARQLPRSELKPSMLPNGVKLATVKAAIDVTSDGHPDLIITEYCCNSPGKPIAECDYTCGATYKRSGKKWLKIDTSTPC